MKMLAALLLSTLTVSTPALAADPAPRPDQLAFREIYKELVETNTTPVSYTHLRAHETVLDLGCRLLLEQKKQMISHTTM